MIDGMVTRVYFASVTASPAYDQGDEQTRAVTVKRRRRPASAAETQRRKANRAADNQYWKQLKEMGRWR